MPSRLIYVPLEKYAERYTEYQSGFNGTIHRQVKALGVEVLVIQPNNNLNRIKTGVVLDAVARCKWAFEQTTQLVWMLRNGEIEKEDVIFFEDFWHPGMEMIPYTQTLVGNKTPIYAFNFAQSLDLHDFTYQMREWISGFEKSWSYCLSGIFCADEHLRQRMMDDDWGNEKTIFRTVGLVYDHIVVQELAGMTGQETPPRRENRVVFSSRWDKEKCPQFFCQLVDTVLKERKDIKFVVCSSAQELRSNDKELVRLGEEMTRRWPGKFELKVGLTKKEYYSELSKSAVQFNCADQDWISYTLLEATTFGCAPLYPNWLSFPAALNHKPAYLYKKGDMQDAKKKLYLLIDFPDVEAYAWVYQKCEPAVHRMLYHMGFAVPKPETLVP